jgi:hypothetical protein
VGNAAGPVRSQLGFLGFTLGLPAGKITARTSSATTRTITASFRVCPILAATSGFAYMERTVGAKWLALLTEIAHGVIFNADGFIDNNSKLAIDLAADALSRTGHLRRRWRYRRSQALRAPLLASEHSL